MRRALRAVAFRCAGCGEIVRRDISRFQATGMGGSTCQCDCGFEPLHVNLFPQRLWLLEGACPACDGVHSTYRPARTFWNGAPVHLVCPTFGITVAILGEPEDVVAEMQRWHADDEQLPLDTESGGERTEVGPSAEDGSSFIDADAMSDALAHLKHLAAKGRLRCSCGNPRLRAEMFADEVSVHCPSCGASVSLPVARRSDVPAVQSLHEIELVRGGVAQLITRRRPPR